MTDKLKNEHYLITGSGGYIGALLTNELLRQGFYVTLLTTSESDLENPKLRKINWSLTSNLADFEHSKFDRLFPKPCIIFHLAHSWFYSEDHQGRDINLIGTVSLYEWAKKNSIKFIFASSISAREGALNQYGRTKYLIEQSLEMPHAVVARIGLIYGGAEVSQWGLLCKIIGKTRILPMIDPWVRVQPIHLKEVVDALITMASKSNFSKKIYTVASDKDISFGEFLKITAIQRFNKSLIILPVPSHIALFFLKLIPKKFINSTIIKEKILGLVGIKRVQNNEDLQEINLIISPVRMTNFTDTITIKIEKEAIFVMSGIFDKTPSMESIEKYVFAIKKYYQGSPYRLPFWIVHPFLLKFIEPSPFFKTKNQSAADLLSRLNLALGILESGDAAGNVYNYKKNGRKRLIALNSLIIEALIFPVRWLYWQVRR